MTRRLRILHVVVQPVLVWDDGDTLEDGPAVDAIRATVASLPELAVRLPTEVEHIQGLTAEPNEPS